MLDTQDHFFQLDVSLGKINVLWDAEGKLTALQLQCEEVSDLSREIMRGSGQIPKNVVQVLEDLRSYFQQGLPLSAVPWDLLRLEQVTAFQREVYRATVEIPFAETRTYAWVAHRIGHPQACRAVGQALSKNPFPIIIPCHRVVPAQGGLGGFMGNNDPASAPVNSKKRLIEREYSYLNPVFPFLQGCIV